MTAVAASASSNVHGALLPHEHLSLREYILAHDRPARVFRELWSCEHATYLGLRQFLSAQRSQGHSTGIGTDATHGRSTSGAPCSVAPAAVQAYLFDGVRFIFDNSKSPISLVSFAPVRNDLLAVANSTGSLWFISLQQQEPVVQQAQQMHKKSVTDVDWSYDSSELLTCSEDGYLCVWDTSTASCIRSIAVLHPAMSCKFHKLSPNLAAVGTSAGTLELWNISTGTLHLRYNVAGPFQAGLQVTAVECSNQHVFAGDSSGHVHTYRNDVRHGQVQQLVWSGKAQVAGHKAAPVLQAYYLPYCPTTDTPVLITTAADGTISTMKLVEPHRLELFVRCCGPPVARAIRGAVCPLSAIHGVPRVTQGGEDTNVYIYNIEGTSKHGAAARSHGARPAVRPAIINTLKGHRAPVVDVSWTFDESLLATGDCDGVVIVWKRAMS